MFCKNCGKEIPEGSSVCPACSPEVQQEQVAEEVKAETNEAATETFADPSFEEQPKKAKGKKGLLIGGIAGVIAVALAVIVALNFSFVEGFWLKTFGSDEDYFAYVEKKSLSQFVGSTTDVYGTSLEELVRESVGSEAQLELNISDEAMTLLENAVPAISSMGIDLNNFKNISIALDWLLDGNKQSIGAALNIGENSLLDLNAILDMEGKDAYIGIPSLADKYLMLENVLDTMTDSTAAQIDTAKVANALPADEELNIILNKYLEIAIDNLGSVSKKTENVTVGEYSQKLTVLENKITEQDLLNVVKAVLEELKNDSDIKAVIEDIEKFALEEYADLADSSGYEKGEIYNTFIEAVNEAMDELGEAEATDEELATLIDYVDGNHEIVGRAISIGGEAFASYITVSKGNNFAFSAECEKIGFAFTGNGTNKNDAITAEYKLEVESKEIAQFTLDKFSVKDEKINGSITVEPSASLLSEAAGDDSNTMGTMLSMLSPAVKLSFETKDTEGSITLTVLSKEKEFVSLTISGKNTTGEDVKLPTDAISSDEIVEWANTIDLSKLVDALKDIKLPDSIMDTVDQYVGYIDEMGGLGDFIGALTSFSDTDYDDSYDDSYYNDYAY